MTELERPDEVIALKQARAQLEVGLNGNENWLALRQDAGGASRALHEQALAGNPLYKSWKLVNEAIESLRPAESTSAPAEAMRQRDAESKTAPDDLTLIRGITPVLARRLTALGIRRYGDIAAWRPDDVRAASVALGLGREISRQNWIEQAALLERRAHVRRTETKAAHPIAEPERSATAVPTEPPPEAQDARQGAEARNIDLPDILEHIRSDAASRSGGLPAVSLDAENEAPDVPAKTNAASHPDAADGQSVATPPAAAQRSPIPIVAASSHVSTDAAERAKRLKEERRRLSEAVKSAASADGMERAAHEPDEATVTFVIREPVQPASHAVDVPTVRGRQRKPPLLEQSPASAAGEDEPGERYVPPSSHAEEAEVAILGPKDIESKRSLDRAAASVRRLLKTLTGN